MAGPGPETARRSRRTRYSALALALLWALFWSYFGLASGISEGLSPGGVFLHTSLPGLLFLGTALLAWRWRRIGALLLVLEALLVAIAYPILAGRFPLTTILFVLLTMSLPPLLAGFLLLRAGRSDRG